MTEGEFRAVVEAVNEAIAGQGGAAGYRLDVTSPAFVEEYWTRLAVVVETATCRKTILTKHCRPGEEEAAYGTLAAQAADYLGWPAASSREEARLKIALAGSAPRIAKLAAVMAS